MASPLVAASCRTHRPVATCPSQKAVPPSVAAGAAQPRQPVDAPGRKR